jgi:hypothetical protein
MFRIIIPFRIEGHGIIQIGWRRTNGNSHRSEKVFLL